MSRFAESPATRTAAWLLAFGSVGVPAVHFAGVAGLREVNEAWGCVAALCHVGLWLLWCWARGGIEWTRSAAAWLPVCLIAAAAVQLLPLGVGLGSASPKAAEVRAAAAAALGEEAPAVTCASLHPSAGRDGLFRLAVGTLFFWAVLHGPADRRHLRRVLALAAAGGGVMAYAMLLQTQTPVGNRVLFWADPADLGDDKFYWTFRNRNRFAGLMDVCIGAAIGLLLESLASRGTAGRPFPGPGSGSGPGPEDDGRRGRSGPAPSSPAGGLSGEWLVPLVPAIGGMAAAVLVSLSRGAAVSLMGMLALVAAAAALRPGAWRTAALISLVALAAAAGVAGLGWSKVEERLSTLGDEEALRQSRLILWAGAWEIVGDHFPAGCGLGAFPAVYPAYRPPAQTSMFYFPHAENEYLEVAAELGLPGMAVLVVGVWLLARAVLRCLWASLADGRRRASGAGPLAGGAALAAAGAAAVSFGDFGFHGGATTFPFLAALALCFRQSAEIAGLPSRRVPGGRRAVLALGAALAAFGTWGMGGPLAEAEAARRIAAAGSLTSPEANHPARVHLEAAAELRPGDTLIRRLLGFQLLPLAESEFGPHRARSDGPVYRAAFDHFRAAAEACPAEPNAWDGLGLLADLVRDPRAPALLAMAEKRGGHEPAVHWHAGLALLRAGRFEDAVRRLARAAEISASFRKPMEDGLVAVLTLRPQATDWAALVPSKRVREYVAAVLRSRGRTDEAAALLSAYAPRP